MEITWPSTVTRAIDACTGIVIDGNDEGVGSGFEAWLHETAHFVLLRGCLMIENPAEREFWVSSRIDAVKTQKSKSAGQKWGIRHELKTLAMELLVAQAIGFEIDAFELALYAVENGNLAPRWADSTWAVENTASARSIVRVVKRKQSSAEVVEAAAYLSRAISTLDARLDTNRPTSTSHSSPRPARL